MKYRPLKMVEKDVLLRRTNIKKKTKKKNIQTALDNPNQSKIQNFKNAKIKKSAKKCKNFPKMQKFKKCKKMQKLKKVQKCKKKKKLRKNAKT